MKIDLRTFFGRIDYVGMTYPKMIFGNIGYWLWKRHACKRKMHLFDEVAGIGQHYLICDACGFMVYISYTETEKEAISRIDDGMKYIESIAIEKSEDNKSYYRILTKEVNINEFKIKTRTT